MDDQNRAIRETNSAVNLPAVEQVFEKVLKECTRSETKLNLHENKDKDLCLAFLLEQVRTYYGQDICDSFQKEYEPTQPVLSFLFAQITNIVLESAFHQGRCHGQAIYSLFELFKANVFNATLVCSRTGDLSTEHYYLIIPDNYGFNRLKQTSQLYVRIARKQGKPIFGEETIFFDSWSKELRRWKNFSGIQWKQFLASSKYAKGISETDQALFKPFILCFNNDKITSLRENSLVFIRI